MNEQLMRNLVPLLMLLVVVAGFGGANVLLSKLLGPRRPGKVKEASY